MTANWEEYNKKITDMSHTIGLSIVHKNYSIVHKKQKVSKMTIHPFPFHLKTKFLTKMTSLRIYRRTIVRTFYFG